MATRKVRKKKRVSRGGRKIVIIRIGRKVYRAPLTALGRPLTDAALIKAIMAIEKKKCCHGLHFAGVYGQPMFMLSFGNGHLPD
jgi:hypothetical protein